MEWFAAFLLALGLIARYAKRRFDLLEKRIKILEDQNRGEF